MYSSINNVGPIDPDKAGKSLADYLNNFGQITFFALIGLAIISLIVAIVVAKKAGYSGWWGAIAVLFPPAGLVLVLLLAMLKWPALKERDEALGVLASHELLLPSHERKAIKEAERKRAIEDAARKRMEKAQAEREKADAERARFAAAQAKREADASVVAAAAAAGATAAGSPTPASATAGQGPAAAKTSDELPPRRNPPPLQSPARRRTASRRSLAPRRPSRSLPRYPPRAPAPQPTRRPRRRRHGDVAESRRAMPRRRRLVLRKRNRPHRQRTRKATPGKDPSCKPTVP